MAKRVAPEELLNGYKSNPYTVDVHRILRKMVEEKRGKEWDKRVLIPMDTFIETYCKSIGKLTGRPIMGKRLEEEYVKNNLAYILETALFTWSCTKGIYRFDDALFEELKTAEFTGYVQRSILERIPEPCTVINIKGLFEEGFDYVMFLLNVNPITNKLCMFVILQDGETEENFDNWDTSYFWFSLEKEALGMEDFWNGYKLALARCEDDTEGPQLDNAYIEHEYVRLFGMQHADELSLQEKTEAISNRIRYYMKKVLPYLLYVCTYNPDIRLLTPEKALKASPDMPKKYVVGERVGQVLRTYKTRYVTAKDGDRKTGPQKRPHFRNSYFRQQLYGPRPKGDEPDQRYHKLIWVPASYINMKGHDIFDLEPTSKTFK